MYRWTERTGYRVIEIQPFERGMVYALFGALALQIGPIIPLLTFGRFEDLLYSIGVPLVFGAVVCALILYHWWRNTNWIGIPTRPGPLTWGDRSGRTGMTEGAATHVEAVQHAIGSGRVRYGVVAVLPTGQRVPLLGGWSTASREEIEGIVVSINREIGNLDWSGPA